MLMFHCMRNSHYALSYLHQMLSVEEDSNEIEDEEDLKLLNPMSMLRPC